MSIVEKGADIEMSCEKNNPQDDDDNSSEKSSTTKKQLKKDKNAAKAKINDNTKGARNNPHIPAILQRQGTFTMTNYRYRKSISQIDMKLARRNGLLYFSPVHKKRSNNGSSNDEKIEIESHKNLQLAGMRVYVTFMKNAWRKRRNEAKTLTNLIKELRKDNVIVKNQLHLFKTLFYAEKSANEELGQQLKKSIDKIHTLEESQKIMQAEIVQCEKKRTNAEQQLMVKMQDHHALNIFFKQTKTELFGVMSELQDIRNKLNTEETKVEQLESEKLQLIKNFEVLCEHTQSEVDELERNCAFKNNMVVSLKDRMRKLEAELKNSKECLCSQIGELSASELKLKQELEDAQSELKVLRHCLAATMGQRIQKCWKNAFVVQRATFHVIHWFAFGLLPAVPAPVVSNPFPFNFTLKKAMSIMKR